MIASWSQLALAAVIRIDFTGSVTVILGAGMTQAETEAALGDSIHIGTPFSGYLVIDDAAAPTSTSPQGDLESASATYSFAPPYVVHTEIGDYFSDTVAPPFEGSYIEMRVYDQQQGFETFTRVLAYARESSLSRSGDGMYLVSAILGLWPHRYDDPLQDTSLAHVPWNLTAFPDSGINWSFANDPFASETAFVGGTLTSLSYQIVPEPSPASLLALAVAICFLSRECAASSKT